MSAVNRIADPEEMALIADAAQGDLQAFNQLVLRYQDMAYHHAFALMGDPAAAEDVTQESFIKAFQGIHSFRGSSLRGWVLKIVTNTAYDSLRRSGLHPTQPLFPEDDDGEEIESPAWLRDPQASVQAAVERRELVKALNQVLAELPDAYRKVLTLIDVYELDYSEAAQALGIPLGTVKSRLARARLQMQEKLKDTLYLAGQVPGPQAGLAS